MKNEVALMESYQEFDDSNDQQMILNLLTAQMIHLKSRVQGIESFVKEKRENLIDNVSSSQVRTF